MSAILDRQIAFMQVCDRMKKAEAEVERLRGFLNRTVDCGICPVCQKINIEALGPRTTSASTPVKP
jgi:hypothetical protein